MRAKHFIPRSEALLNEIEKLRAENADLKAANDLYRNALLAIQEHGESGVKLDADSILEALAE